MVAVTDFVHRAEEIAAEEPGYQHGHSGSDGLCDCIGLVIGAIRRAGGQWRGMHGTNYAARGEMVSIDRITSAGVLAIGELVYKAYDPGQGGYNLPSRYERGGEYYNGDLRDYYHVGIVVSVSPLRIRHMTTPRPKMDTVLGKWAYHGRLKNIDYSGGGEKIVETVTLSGGNLDKPINIRKEPSKKAVLIAQAPQGSQADLLEPGADWARIRYKNVTGYVASEYAHINDGGSGGGNDGDDGDMVTVPRKLLIEIYEKLADIVAVG